MLFSISPPPSPAGILEHYISNISEGINIDLFLSFFKIFIDFKYFKKIISISLFQKKF